ncbi:hypothetical protein M3J09_009733 [Ascochyta lentis]
MPVIFWDLSSATQFEFSPTASSIVCNTLLQDGMSAVVDGECPRARRSNAGRNASDPSDHYDGIAKVDRMDLRSPRLGGGSTVHVDPCYVVHFEVIRSFDMELSAIEVQDGRTRHPPPAVTPKLQFESFIYSQTTNHMSPTFRDSVTMTYHEGSRVTYWQNPTSSHSGN